MAKINPIPPNLQPQDVLRFWSKVDIHVTENCWPYMGERQKKSPYGTVTFGKRIGGKKRRKINAHRVAYFIATGIWALNDVCHHCDNPPCCNPNHLFAGSRSDNMQDAQRKGRTVITVGSQRTNAKLNEDTVRFIRKTWSERLMNRREMAEMFGVSQGAIQQVTDGRRWKHVI